ncbi:hypothetical protein AHAS_Ahas13G0474900 [Arachis hypogaea]
MEGNMILNNALIDAYGKCGEPNSSYSVFFWMQENDVVSWTSMVVAYARASILDEAFRVFHSMPFRNIISWTALITGFARNRCCCEALNLFKQMLEEGVNLNAQTFVSVLGASADEALIGRGKEVHARPEHYALLIDLLGRKNRLKEAVDLIEKMPSRIRTHIAVWGPVLGTCRVHGNLDLARRAAEALFELEPENTARYVMLSNIYAASGRFDNADRIRMIMNEKGLKKGAVGLS